ncbi:hypothetical protein HID58_059340 [Brassica napus]|uniref:Uncharacterized protein n=1 Tax=Brassica napus TaxID=3708 RepID=A0ABQ7ZSM7_BRANA|nr:hypothetical protein HID58_059340 [Brassica napus]
MGETDEPEPVEAPDTNHRKQPPLLLPPEVQRDLRDESPPTENEETCLRLQLTNAGGINGDRSTPTEAQSSSIESRSGRSERCLEVKPSEEPPNPTLTYAPHHCSRSLTTEQKGNHNRRYIGETKSREMKPAEKGERHRRLRGRQPVTTATDSPESATG